MTAQPTFPNAEYGLCLTSLKDLIRQSRVKPALAVNRELVLLYWRLGQEILQRQDQQGWGAKVVAQLAQLFQATQQNISHHPVDTGHE